MFGWMSTTREKSELVAGQRWAARSVRKSYLAVQLLTNLRSRRGRVYSLVTILGMLLLVALEGEGSLRGMGMLRYSEELIKHLGRGIRPRPPGLSMVWYVLQRVEGD
jgi:hypothetical protein